VHLLWQWLSFPLLEPLSYVRFNILKLIWLQVILITLKKRKNLHVKLTLLTKLLSSSNKLALLIHQDMCLVQRQLKSLSAHWAVEGKARDCYKTIEVKEHPSLTRAVLQTVNILFHWISAALATAQASLVFTPYRTHEKQQERDLGWTKVPHWPRVIWKTDSGVLCHAFSTP